MAFVNDGQLAEFSAAVGVFDDQTPPSGSGMPADWLYIASHFVSMRGIVALERLMQCRWQQTSLNSFHFYLYNCFASIFN
jgi:hypothetical protein